MDDFDRRQTRGELEAYERYLAGMDASMRQKIALTTAHLLCEGKVADMGMGSGAGSDAFAALYPGLKVVGVDLDPHMVELARKKYARPNLEFVLGDIAGDVFPPESLDGILDSSVLHHVTSFGGYAHEKAGGALRAQARALRRHGTLIVRDFLAPSEDIEVFLDVPTTDGDGSNDPRTCSTAALLERFSREFRLLHDQPGFELQRSSEPPRPGFCRYRLRHRHAVEFVLRKDYRTDWESELKEEYTYFDQRQFEEEFAKLGMRVLASTPLRNPWILQHRFEDRFSLSRIDGTSLPWPATNCVIAGEKVPSTEGVRFAAGSEAPPRSFLSMTHYRHRRTGQTRDLVRRPHLTVDVIPHFDSGNDLYVLARTSYPRPILAVRKDIPSLDESRAPHYVTEPLNVLQTDRSLGETVEEMLERYCRIAPSRLRRFRMGPTYYPSPGGTQEEVRAVFVEMVPLLVEDDLPALSGFSTSGRVRAIQAEQVLRAAQVGALPDARLELNVYDLLLARGRRPLSWIGEEIRPCETAAPLVPIRLVDLASRPSRRLYERVDGWDGARFLELRCRTFEERNADSLVVASGELEYILPSTRSANTVACAVLATHGETTYLGVDDDDLPAAQCFTGNSEIVVAPAWRLPSDVTTMTLAREWTRQRLKAEYGVECGRIWHLGGSYFPSAAMSPEVVHPLAIEVAGLGDGEKRLQWVRINEVGESRDRLLDGHLRIVALRAAHALERLQAASRS